MLIEYLIVDTVSGMRHEPPLFRKKKNKKRTKKSKDQRKGEKGKRRKGIYQLH